MTAPATRQEFIARLPKVELHLHLEGSLAPELLLRLAARNRVRIPFAQPDDFGRLYRYRDFRDFANALLFGVALLRTPQDFFDAVTALGAMLRSQNVLYAEVTWTPQFYLKRDCSLDDILEAMNAARHALERRGGPLLRWIPDLVRSYPEPAVHVARWAASAKARGLGVVALGLGGPEADHPAARFGPIFAAARRAGLPANPHAGEGDGPASVWSTLERLQPRRIGHGVRSAEDPALVSHLARTAIPLEVCLTSNVRLGVYPSLAEHPVKRLIEAGCAVTLNSDDPVLFQTTLNDEYRIAIEACGLEPAHLVQANLAALRASYLEEEPKAEMTTAFEQRVSELG